MASSGSRPFSIPDNDLGFKSDHSSEGMNMDPKRLTDVSLFQGLAKKDLQHVGRWTDEVDISEGKSLAEQGIFA